jgi:MATE family multidrug resistance protein
MMTANESHTNAIAADAESAPLLTPDPSPATTAHDGGYRELLTLALPFILSSSFTTIQLFIDRIFIAKLGKDAVAAVMPTVGVFWTPMALLQFTVMYVTVFVAQYFGAKRPERIGPILWQGIYLALGFGLLFPLSIPLADSIFQATNHADSVKALESAYFRGLCFAALPMILVAAATGFFAGRGQSWTVLLINAIGAAVNAIVAVPLVLWRKDDPAAAMFNAGLAAAIGSAVSVILGFLLLFRRKYEAEFRVFSGWRFDTGLMKRLLKFGLPNGAQFCIEGLAFTCFILLVGAINTAAGAATGVTFSLNLLTFLPVMGLAQGVEVLVGKRQGEERPDIAAMTAHRGVIVGTIWMAFVALLYLMIPETLAAAIVNRDEPGWEDALPLIPVLLAFVAVYSLADGANVVYAFALRGAGDTKFVSLLAIGLSWPIMVIPTYFCIKYSWGIRAAWSFATAYVIALAFAFWLRFRSGKWRTMKVIEPHVAVE